ncbi:MAG: DUF445 domain-containing protein [Desulfuromonadales bacterium]|nr:DUF445 domain-containing protein [Desulfuromonadales bacterium]
MDVRKRTLVRNKAIAGGLLVGAALLFVIARFHKGNGLWEWVAAFSEAAMVGALADWFAVVALFRYPLGVPIPHTAIIPNKKEAIAESLAEFIRDKFLATEALLSKIRELNPARRLSVYLMSQQHADGLATGLTRIITESIDFLDDDRVRKILRVALHDRIEKFDLATSVGQLLETLRKDNRHQAVLDDMLRRFSAWIATADAQDKLANAVDNWLNTEYPLLSKFIPNRDQFAKGAGEKIAKKVNQFLQEINDDPGHELRCKFDTAVSDCIARLKGDDVLRAKIEEIKLEAINNDHLTTYVSGLAGDIKSWLIDDLDRSHSRIRKSLSGAAIALGTTLTKNTELIDSINEHLEHIVVNYSDKLRAVATKHVAGTVKQWNEDDFVSEIELSIGSDLQFIRMNGTLVGGVIGLLLHAISLLLG